MMNHSGHAVNGQAIKSQQQSDSGKVISGKNISDGGGVCPAPPLTSLLSCGDLTLKYWILQRMPGKPEVWSSNPSVGLSVSQVIIGNYVMFSLNSARPGLRLYVTWLMRAAS